MGNRTQWNHSSSFKPKVALVALAEEKALAELAEYYGVHPNQITTRKQQLLFEQADTVCCKDYNKETSPDIKVLHTKIGQLTLENDFLDGVLSNSAVLSARRRSTVDMGYYSASRQGCLE